jgi:hypothetical protein
LVAGLIAALLALRPAGAIEPEIIPPNLAQVKRIYVEQLGGGHASDQMRDMIIAALQNSKLFVLTDNPERAEALLRGSSDDVIFTEDHSSAESIGLHATAGGGSSSHAAFGNGSSSHENTGAGITDNETSHIQERRHEASASLRLVNVAGDVIWSTTQESSGGKFRGAMADVADKITRQLVDDTRKARVGFTAVVPPPPSMRQ